MPQLNRIAGANVVIAMGEGGSAGAMASARSGFQLQAFSTLLRGTAWVTPTLSVVAVEGGYALCLEVHHQKERTWLFAEKSGQMRVFKKADTALALCRKLGVSSVRVELAPAPQRKARPARFGKDV